MLWEEIIAKSEKMGATSTQVFQEEVQKVLLTSLSRDEAFNHIVFQGGTALRLFYGNPRFSEDLDFVLKQDEMFDLTRNIPNMQTSVEDAFPFIEEASLDIQRNDDQMQRLVLKIRGRPFKRIRVHLELAYVPSYHNKPRVLDYPPLNPVVRVEEDHEILADKLVALGNRPYIKGRDVWDVYFLAKEKNIIIPWDLVFRKARDYGTTPSNLKKNILEAMERLKKEGLSILHSEILRFMPKRTLDQYSENLREIVDAVVEIIRGGVLEER